MLEGPTLYAIVDPSRCSVSEEAGRDREVVEFTRALLKGGAGVVQLRDKQGTSRQTYALACQLAQTCRDYDVAFVVNDRVDIALAAGADGVHVGPEDVPVAAVRQIVDDEFIVGASAGTPEKAVELQRQGADYLGVGAVYEARESKPNASAPRGPEALRVVVDAVDIPVVGIGGIDAENAAEVMEAGAAGVAVISALCRGDGPQKGAQTLCGAISGG